MSSQQQLKEEMEAASRELIERAKNPQPPFKISKQQLIQIASACQERNFSEEVDLLELSGGDKWLEQGLCTNFKKGISGDQQDLERRNFAFQNNEKPPIELKSFFQLIMDALEDFTLRILMVAAVVSIAIDVGTAHDNAEREHAWVEGFAILIAVFVCATVTAVNDYQKERQFQKLNSVADERKVVSVWRNGEVQNIHMSKVLVGEVVQLSEGMEIPADGYVLEAAELTTDESAMTGETDPIRKTTLPICIAKRDELIKEGSKNTAGRHDVPSCVILSGTRILTGEGKLLVTVVGDSSCVGKISALLRQSDPEETPLQIKLTKIAEDIGNFGMYSACAIVGVLIIRFGIEKIIQNQWDNSRDWAELLSFFIIGITVVVVAIPEGLPLAVTLSLAYSVKKMLSDQNLVRKLQACETMGGANTICSDKTGTLTKNVMTLTTWWNDEYQDFKYEAKVMNLNDYMPKHVHELYLQSCACNSSAAIRPDEKGSKTEIAILKQLDQLQKPYEVLREQYSDIIQKMPFSSARKRMSIVINTNGKKRMFVKGASELILRSCSKFHSKKTNQVVNLDEKLRKEVEDNIAKMANQALRTICLAYKDLNGNEDMNTKDNLGVFDVETHDLTLFAVFGIADVIRPEVPHAVSQCKKAGIKVRMVTGDNIDTARAIAIKCGIIDQGDQNAIVIEGPEFIKKTGGVVCKKCRIFDCNCPRDIETAKKLGKKVRVDIIKYPEEFDKIYPYLCVMARSRPEDKYALVTGLIERDNVVAVTGDGTNDAPALKKADVGFAMGIAGTEVAREAASIILLDDNFKSIVSAVMWGRNIYDAIKKFLQFQLTVNVVAVFITLIAAAVTKQDVLQPIQMLWINLIMDTFASLALATEPPTEELLDRKPHNRYEYIISKKMVKLIMGQAIVQIIILLILVFNGDTFLPEYPDFCHNPNDSSCFDTNIIQQFDLYVKNGDINKTETQWDSYISKITQAIYNNTVIAYPYQIRYSDSSMKYVTSGQLKSLNGLNLRYKAVYQKFTTPSRHYTYIFNTFVMMQVFNFLNSRKLQDEINIFEGVTRNGLFGIIVLIIIACQILLVSLGSVAFQCYSYGGLTVPQWFICIGFGSIMLFSSLLFKIISEDKIIPFNLGWGDQAVKPKDEDDQSSADGSKKEEEKEKANFEELELKENKKSDKNSVVYTDNNPPPKQVNIEYQTQQQQQQNNNQNQQQPPSHHQQKNQFQQQNELSNQKSIVKNVSHEENKQQQQQRDDGAKFSQNQSDLNKEVKKQDQKQEKVNQQQVQDIQQQSQQQQQQQQQNDLQQQQQENLRMQSLSSKQNDRKQIDSRQKSDQQQQRNNSQEGEDKVEENDPLKFKSNENESQELLIKMQEQEVPVFEEL